MAVKKYQLSFYFRRNLERKKEGPGEKDETEKNETDSSLAIRHSTKLRKGDLLFCFFF
jgi:hypothetical protein